MLLSNYPKERHHLINFLHLIQDELGYLSEEAIELLSEHFSLSPAEIFGVATFYASFRITQPAEHEIQVCQGTACHVRGAEAILEEFSRQLDKHYGEQGWSSKVSLRKVNCLGCCAIGPVAVVDGQIESRMTLTKVREIVRRLYQKDNLEKIREQNDQE
ncbi:MAG: NAD(P)H-dependent oxidoreductase subunit E [Candidatus Aminicenantes bacterium]|nr:NAD(P)H-dependent oxidoreductase subunit E [Candidatus Aminicenantes bacterium]